VESLQASLKHEARVTMCEVAGREERSLRVYTSTIPAWRDRVRKVILLISGYEPFLLTGHNWLNQHLKPNFSVAKHGFLSWAANIAELH
jgi:hypothetical protein